MAAQQALQISASSRRWHKRRAFPVPHSGHFIFIGGFYANLTARASHRSIRTGISGRTSQLLIASHPEIGLRAHADVSPPQDHLPRGVLAHASAETISQRCPHPSSLILHRSSFIAHPSSPPPPLHPPHRLLPRGHLSFIDDINDPTQFRIGHRKPTIQKVPVFPTCQYPPGLPKLSP